MTTSGEDSIGSPPAVVAQRLSRYETQKRRDWQAFTKYLSTHLQSLPLRRCSGEHVLGFLRYLDRFGKTRVHAPPCPAYGGGARAQQPGAACQCPMRQAWGSLDALVGRLRAAYDEHHGRGGGGDDGAAASVDNPFAAPAVRLYLRDVREAQSVARGISYNKKRKRSSKQGGGGSSSSVGGGGASVSSKDGGSGVDDAVQQCTRTRVNQSALIVQRCMRTRVNASALIVQRCAQTLVNGSALMPPAPGGSGDPAAGC